MTLHLHPICQGCEETQVFAPNVYCDDCHDFLCRPEVSNAWADEQYVSGSSYDRARDDYEQFMEVNNAQR